MEIFGSENAARVRALAGELGVVLHLGATVSTWDGRTMILDDGASYPVDRIFAMPRLTGRPIDGLPLVDEEFIPVDRHQQVLGSDGPLSGVYAVGDATDFPAKQGGLASDEADAAVAAIEAELGSGPVPSPFSGEIQAILLTDQRRMIMRAEISEDGSSKSLPTPELGGPEQKIHSRLLGDRLRELDAQR